MVIGLCACGDKGPDVTGKYICVGESYEGFDSYNEPYAESWIELKKGGKGTYFSGFEFDMTRGYIGFAPKINESDFRAFWAVDGAWGNYAQCENEATLTVLYGSAELSSLKADGRQANLVLLNGQPIDFSMQAEEIAFAEKVALHKGDILTIK